VREVHFSPLVAPTGGAASILGGGTLDGGAASGSS
jgi:hypothetical protein